MNKIDLNSFDFRQDFYEVHFTTFGAHSLDVLVYVFFKVPDWSTELQQRHNFLLEVLRLAKELGVEAMCIPTAGNAGSALSAYCAKADIKAHIFMPEATPKTFQLDCEVMGAEVTKVKGDISELHT